MKTGIIINNKSRRHY